MKRHLLFLLPLILLFPNRSTFALEDQIQEEQSRGIEIHRLQMVVNFSKTLYFQKDMGPIYLTDPAIVDFRRVIHDGKIRTLLLIPKAPGFTDLTVHDASGTVMARLYVRIHGPERTDIIDEMIAEDRTQTRVERITLTEGVSLEKELPEEIGPIYLTNAQLFDFRRIQENNSIRRLIFFPRKAGSTDMTVHDENLNIIVRYFVTVLPAEQDSRAADRAGIKRSLSSEEQTGR